MTLSWILYSCMNIFNWQSDIIELAHKIRLPPGSRTSFRQYQNNW
jgi:hypothetical protein